MCGLLMITYFAHIAAYAGLLITLTSMTVFDWLYDLLKGQHAEEKRLLKTRLIILVPALILGAAYLFVTRDPGNKVYVGADWLRTIFFSHATLVTYTIRHELIVFCMWVTIGFAIVINIIKRLSDRKFLSRRDGILAACSVFFVLFWVMPWWQNNGGWINDRIFLLMLLFFMFWFERFSRLFRFSFFVIFTVLSIAHLGLYMQEFSSLQTELTEFVSGAHMIEPHSTVKALVGDDMTSKTLGPTININPFKHVYAYYGLEKDIVCLDNYEAKFNYFLVNWNKAVSDLPDYIIVWRQDSRQHLLRRLDSRYEIIYSTNHLKLLKKS